MRRKFVGKLIRIMMTKSSSCDILKKKRTIRRGSGSRPKGSYLMDLRFWNYVIPDGSTTRASEIAKDTSFGTMSFQMVLLPVCRPLWGCGGFGTMSFQMVLLLNRRQQPCARRFGTMSFQMVLLRSDCTILYASSFGTMSFQMVLLRMPLALPGRGRFGTMSFQMVLLRMVGFDDMALCFGTMSFQMVLLQNCSGWSAKMRFWNYVIPDGSTTGNGLTLWAQWFWNYVIPDGSTTVFLCAIRHP